nr:MAG TPA: tail tape measure protein [Caudoviricetes sp.]
MANELAVIQTEKTIEELKKLDEQLNDTIDAFKELVGVANTASNLFAKGTPKEYVEGLKQNEKLTKSITNFNKELIAVEEKKTRLLISEQRLLTEKSKTENQQIRNKQLLSREEERINKLREKEIQRLQAAEQLYSKLEVKLKTLQNEYKQLATKKEIGIKLTEREEQSMNRLHARIEKYDKALKAVDASMGKHQRNVGNYASAFNPLQNSINQLTREAPAFANSVQTGFMAISNNLPVFFDSISSIMKQNKELQAQGQKTKSVLGQLAGAFLSWNTALSVGVTLLTMYGADIWKWAKSLFSGKEAIDKMAESQKTLNEAFKSSDYKKAVRDVSEMKNIFDLAKEGVINKDKALKKYNDSLGKVMGTAKNLNEAEQILTKNADNYIKATLYKAAANLALDKASEAMIKAELARQKKVEDRMKEDGFFSGFAMLGDDGSGSASANYMKTRREKLSNERKKEIEEAEKDAKAQEDIAKQFLKNAANYGKGLDLDIGVKDNKDKKKDDLSKEQRDAIDRLQAQRDNKLAELEEKRGEIGEKAYQEGRIKVIKEYATAIQNLLKGNSAKEQKIKGQVRLKAAQELQKANKEIYDYEAKSLEALSKLRLEALQNQKAEYEKNEYGTETERLSNLMVTNALIIDETEKFYNERVALAKKYKQDYESIEEEKDNKITSLNLQNDDYRRKMPDAVISDLEAQQKKFETLQSISKEEQKQAILNDNSFSASQKEYLLKSLELDIQRKINDEKIKSLKLEEAELLSIEERTNAQEEKLLQIKASIAKTEADNTSNQREKNQLETDYILQKFSAIKETMTKGFRNLGLDSVADEFSAMFNAISTNADKFGKKFENDAEKWKAIAESAVNIITGFGKQLIQEQTEQNIASINEEMEAQRSRTEMELGFIDSRLDALNRLSVLTADQIAERNALEDEAMVIKEQQAQREKMMEAQKARAKQRASAQQVLIDAAAAAAKTLAEWGVPAGLIPAGIALSFGALQAGLIMSKDPVPHYFVGRKGGREEIAWTQERGAEMITDKKGNIKTLGSNRGQVLTKLDEGDIVYTASETKGILNNLQDVPVAGDNVFKKLAMRNVTPVTIVNEKIDYDKLASKIGEQQDRVMRKYDKTSVFELNGYIYTQKGGQIPVAVSRVKKTKNIIKIRGNERD